MFDKFKQAKQLQEIRSALSKEKESCEKGGVRVVINGQMQVEEVNIDSQLDVQKVEKLVKECTNEAFQKIQKKVAKKMQQMGAF